MMSEENLKIRLATYEDINSIVSLVRSSFNETYLIASIYTCKGIEKFIKFEMENECSPYRYFVAELNNSIVGFAEFKLFYETSCAFLNMISTDNNHKGKGIANKIFEYAKNYVLKLNFNNIQLDVFSSNKIAQSWYLSLGFKIESSKSFHKYNFPKTSLKPTLDNFIFTNFSNFKCLYETFNFSFMQLVYEKKNLNIGIIGNVGILREKLTYQDDYKNLFVFLQKKNFQNLYYIGEEFINEDFFIIDNIHRMKFNF